MVRRKVKTAVFDYDGTSADTLLRQFKWFKFWADFSNVAFDSSSFENFRVKYGEAYSLSSKKHSNGLEAIQGVYDYFELPSNMSDFSHPIHDIYENFNLENPVSLFDGIPELFEYIKSKDIFLMICTSNYESIVRAGLKHAGVNDLVDEFVGGKSIVRASNNGKTSYYQKPSKKIMQRVLKIAKSRPEESIHFCDTLVDLKSAVNIPYGKGNFSDLINVGHLNGYEREKLKKGIKTPFGKKKFDHYYYNAKEIPEIIDTYL